MVEADRRLHGRNVSFATDKAVREILQTARACYSDTALVLFGYRSQVRKAKSDMAEVERPRSRGATIQDIRRWVRPWIPDTLAGIGVRRFAP